MAECFCGCGRRVGFTRRAYNGTGRLIKDELDALIELDERLADEGKPNDDVSLKRSVGLDHFQNVRAVVHGGSPKIANQRSITAFLRSARELRARCESSGQAGETPKETTIYECPDCEAEFYSEQGYIQHYRLEHQ